MPSPADYDLLLDSWNEMAAELNAITLENERLKAEAGRFEHGAHDGRSIGRLIDSVSDHDLLVGICQDIFGFNPDARFRHNIVKEVRRRFEAARLESANAAHAETTRKLNASYGKLGTRQRMLNAEMAAIREENARLLAEIERLKAELEARGGERSSDPRIVPEFTCLD
jgi:regulator of replication initiation timing